MSSNEPLSVLAEPAVEPVLVMRGRRFTIGQPVLVYSLHRVPAEHGIGDRDPHGNWWRPLARKTPDGFHAVIVGYVPHGERVVVAGYSHTGQPFTAMAHCASAPLPIDHPHREEIHATLRVEP